MPSLRDEPGHCWQCGYHLRGMDLPATCPECSAVSAHRTDDPAIRHMLRRHSRVMRFEPVYRQLRPVAIFFVCNSALMFALPIILGRLGGRMNPHAEEWLMISGLFGVFLSIMVHRWTNARIELIETIRFYRDEQ